MNGLVQSCDLTVALPLHNLRILIHGHNVEEEVHQWINCDRYLLSER